jgi:hypothetical protein
VCPLPPVSGGRGTLAGEKGVGRVPIPTRGIHCICTYFVICGISSVIYNKNVNRNEAAFECCNRCFPLIY